MAGRQLTFMEIQSLIAYARAHQRPTIVIDGVEYYEFPRGGSMAQLDEEHLKMIHDCMDREKRLNEWERNFISDMRRRRTALTAPQLEKLNAIWEKATEKG
jgi:hypothetical protein